MGLSDLISSLPWPVFGGLLVAFLLVLKVRKSKKERIRHSVDARNLPRLNNASEDEYDNENGDDYGVVGARLRNKNTLHNSGSGATK